MSKNLVRITISVAVLLSIPCYADYFVEPQLHGAEHECFRSLRAHKRVPTDFRQLDFITKIDGKKGLFDAKTYHDTLLSIHAVHEIQYGKLDKIANVRVGFYLYDGKPVAVQQLVILEHELNKAGVAHDDQRRKDLDLVLQAAKNDLHEKMKKLRSTADDNPIAKNLKHKMIKYYIETQGIPHSHLKNADQPHEQRALAAMNALEFFVFLNELKYFFEDLCASCTEAHKQYKELLGKKVATVKE